VPEHYLKQIKGQTNALRFLEAALKSGRKSHSYIFNGPPGVGKRTAANWFVAGILCERPDDYVPCGACRSCRTIARENYPYLRFVAPEKSAIKINQIRDIHDFLKYRVEQSVCRFIIIDEAQTMTPEAANSLLKILEEPPHGTTFILLVDNLSRVFPTIISRCQVVNFTGLSKETISEILRERGYEEEKIAAVLPVSQGSAGRALELIEDESLQENRGKIISFLLDLPVTSDRALEFAQECSDLDISLSLGIIISCFRDFLVLGRGEKSQIINPELVNRSLKFTKNEIYKSIERIMEAQQAAGQNANKQLVLENLFLELNGLAS